MIKTLFLILLFVLGIANVKAQSITETKDWSDLISDLQNENWHSSDSLSVICLKKIPEKEMEGFEASLLRYMYIYSEAGLMNKGKLSKQQALKHVKDFTGHGIVLPAHPIALKNEFNSIQMVNSKTDSLFITATNMAATEIFSFEYIIMKDKWPVDDFKNKIGENYRLSGLIKSISVEGNMLPRFRLIVDNGTYQSFK